MSMTLQIVMFCLHFLKSWLWGWDCPHPLSELSKFVFTCPLRDLIWGWVVLPHNSHMEERPAAEGKKMYPWAARKCTISHRSVYYVSLDALCSLLGTTRGDAVPCLRLSLWRIRAECLNGSSPLDFWWIFWVPGLVTELHFCCCGETPWCIEWFIWV